MKSPPIAQHTKPHQFEPLLPQTGLEALRERSREVIRQSLRLSAAVHPDTLASLRELVREMNSYYSNRIEGQSTHPHNIGRALRSDFSDKPDVARLQRVALAHIDAERALESAVDSGVTALSSPFIQQAHGELYSRLDEADRFTAEGEAVQPGQWRIRQVAVGRHEPYMDSSCFASQ